MRARKTVTRHYQWMIKTDFLPRICDPDVVKDVFTNGRKAFEVGVPPTQLPTMPMEFSVAAYRLGPQHGPGGVQLEQSTSTTARARSTSCSTSRERAASLGGDNPLPFIWIADFRRLYNFGQAGRQDLVVPGGQVQPRDADRREPRAPAREAAAGDDRAAEGADGTRGTISRSGT